MTPHDRFLSLMRFQPVDRPTLSEWGPWETTLELWQAETGLLVEELLAWQRECDLVADPAVDFSMRPAFPEETISEDADTITRRDGMGQVYRVFKENPDTSMPEFIGFPVRGWEDWKRIKPLFDPTDPMRYPVDWEARLARMRVERPITKLYGFVASYYGGPSLFGFVRMLMGPEAALYAFYDEPELVHDMMETAAEFSLAVMDRALREAPITYVQFWEDMCYRGGPLISPALAREFMVPRYKRLTERIRAAGIDIIVVDSDGDVRELIPLWLESGINGIMPFEQAAGNDLYAYRKEYGRDLLLFGGIDKRELAKDHAAIDTELARIAPLVGMGGYLPTLDHAIPPDVSYKNFSYYWQAKKRMLGIS
ncbi:MAG: Uroporphyrinogen decarboxylase (URO-D) [bacterium ADurb.Bin429]|nr:MAG: Uroporphyrinogen decarboxylase (URO-D) [bacterium ADurb.Bin429]